MNSFQNDPVRTHYDNLQVARNASPEVIKGAYKYLSQKWHPDKHPSDQAKAERISKIINEAYVVLSDPQARAKHDAWIAEKEADRDQAGEKAWADAHAESGHAQRHVSSVFSRFMADLKVDQVGREEAEANKKAKARHAPSTTTANTKQDSSASETSGSTIAGFIIIALVMGAYYTSQDGQGRQSSQQPGTHAKPTQASNVRSSTPVTSRLNCGVNEIEWLGRCEKKSNYKSPSSNTRSSATSSTFGALWCPKGATLNSTKGMCVARNGTFPARKITGSCEFKGAMSDQDYINCDRTPPSLSRYLR